MTPNPREHPRAEADACGCPTGAPLMRSRCEVIVTSGVLGTFLLSPMAPKQAPALFDQLAKTLQLEGDELARKIKVRIERHCARPNRARPVAPTPDAMRHADVDHEG